ncbi:MAG: ThiF family adenylyltransferase, partial [Firmicutes bacterium]|nr:ThiF family adenylyltransferase [Bacillota bacterium]
RLKVEVLKERLDDLKLGTHIETIARSVAEPKVLDELRGVDVVFGCMDRHWPRYLLSRLAIQYVLPLIDMGTEIGVTGDRLDSVNARVSYVAPGRPCLSCSGVVLSDRIQLETLTPQEQSAHLTMGYSPDFRLHEPAVTDLNMRAAGLAMLLLRHLLQPFMQEGVPVHLRESVVTASVKRDNADISARCVFCDSGIYRGTGDRGPAILL